MKNRTSKIKTIKPKQLAAKLARQFLAKEITFKEMAVKYPQDTNEDDIDKLIDLIEFQPKSGGLSGVGLLKYDEYNRDILKLIETLEK